MTAPASKAERLKAARKERNRAFRLYCLAYDIWMPLAEKVRAIEEEP